MQGNLKVMLENVLIFKETGQISALVDRSGLGSQFGLSNWVKGNADAANFTFFFEKHIQLAIHGPYLYPITKPAS